MKYLFSVCLVLICAVSVSAQPIHGHPQKAAYATAAERPTRSGQCHLTDAGAPIDVATPLSSHLHVDLVQFPEAAELFSAWVQKFAITLHNVAGSVGQVFGNMVRDLVWDETGTSTMPPFVGVPHGDVVKTGHFTVDPTIPLITAWGTIDTERSAPPRGWFAVGLVARAWMDNGDFVEATTGDSAYSVMDPTAPERSARAGGMITNVQCVGTFADLVKGTQFGTAVAEYQGNLPIAPIFAPWTVLAFPYNYSADLTLPIGTFEQRFDLDFHHGMPGTIVRSMPLDGNHSFTPMPIVFDPARMGTGDHRTAQIWTQPSSGKQLSALLVTTVTVGAGVPPPPATCQDPTATNVGGPLPCVFPVVVPPVETWDVFSPVFRLNSKDPARLQVCRTADLATCKELVMK